MPDFDFDFSKARYSFIKEWNIKADEEHELESKHIAARKQQAVKRLVEIKEAKADKEEKMEEEKQTASQQTKERQQIMGAHHPVTPNNQKKASSRPQTDTKKEDPSIWRSVFQKVKNWFGD